MADKLHIFPIRIEPEGEEIEWFERASKAIKLIRATEPALQPPAKARKFAKAVEVIASTHDWLNAELTDTRFFLRKPPHYVTASLVTHLLAAYLERIVALQNTGGFDAPLTQSEWDRNRHIIRMLAERPLLAEDAARLTGIELDTEHLATSLRPKTQEDIQDSPIVLRLSLLSGLLHPAVKYPDQPLGRPDDDLTAVTPA